MNLLVPRRQHTPQCVSAARKYGVKPIIDNGDHNRQHMIVLQVLLRSVARAFGSALAQNVCLHRARVEH